MPRKRMSSKRIAEAIKIQLKITADGLRGRLEQFTFDPKGQRSRARARIAVASISSTYTVEAEAMPAGLLRDKIEPFLPAGALAAAKVAEKSERAWLLGPGWVLRFPSLWPPGPVVERIDVRGGGC